MKKKNKWIPEIGEYFWEVYSGFDFIGIAKMPRGMDNCCIYKYCFKTKKEAQIKAKKIRKLLEE